MNKIAPSLPSYDFTSTFMFPLSIFKLFSIVLNMSFSDTEYGTLYKNIHTKKIIIATKTLYPNLNFIISLLLISYYITIISPLVIIKYSKFLLILYLSIN